MLEPTNKDILNKIDNISNDVNFIRGALTSKGKFSSNDPALNNLKIISSLLDAIKSNILKGKVQNRNDLIVELNKLEEIIKPNVENVKNAKKHSDFAKVYSNLEKTIPNYSSIIGRIKHEYENRSFYSEKANFTSSENFSGNSIFEKIMRGFDNSVSMEDLFNPNKNSLSTINENENSQKSNEQKETNKKEILNKTIDSLSQKGVKIRKNSKDQSSSEQKETNVEKKQNNNLPKSFADAKKTKYNTGKKPIIVQPKVEYNPLNIVNEMNKKENEEKSQNNNERR